MSASAPASKPTIGKNQQKVMPPTPQPEVKPAPRDEEARAYLAEAGWTEQSRNERGDSFWLDPASAGPRSSKKERTVSLPGKDGTDPVTVQQTVCSPAPWAYPMHEAMNIQRQRDAAASSKE
jgi:hypothetical protein